MNYTLLIDDKALIVTKKHSEFLVTKALFKDQSCYHFYRVRKQTTQNKKEKKKK